VRILFISPASEEVLAMGWKKSWFASYCVRKTLFNYSKLTLGSLASALPPGHEVILHDESLGPVRTDMDVDLVGISVLTSTAPRAYHLADEFKRHGRKVIFGGIHATLMPDEALEHCDSVVLGEAEPVMHSVVEDASKGCLKRVYGPSEPFNLGMLKPPRRNLLKFSGIGNVEAVQTSRGCMGFCEFCSVSSFYKHVYRTRPIDSLIDEIMSIPSRNIVFVDDNFTAVKEHAYQVAEKMAETKKRWFCFVDSNSALDRRLMRMLYRGGCRGVSIGFESINENSLIEVEKFRARAKHYREALKNLEKEGLLTVVCFIFGFDSDDKNIFKNTLDFCFDNRVPVASFNVLVPYPGTPLFKRLEKEGRILTRDWSRYIWYRAVYEPKQMSSRELEEGMFWAREKFFSNGRILERFCRALKFSMSFKESFIFLSFLAGYRFRTNLVRQMLRDENRFFCTNFVPQAQLNF